MSFQITQPGFYRRRDGGKAEVFAERGVRWYGCASDGHAMSWSSAGTSEYGGIVPQYFDIVAVWHDPPEPPEPPAGFKLMPRDYVARDGDYGCCCSTDVFLPITNPVWIGRSAEQLDEYRAFVPHYIASPIPSEPWTPTCDLRWSSCKTNDVASVRVLSGPACALCRLEQKWTRGTEVEWRPVAVTP